MTSKTSQAATQPTTIVLNHPSPFDRLTENSRIVLGVLRDDGWTIDRVDGGQHLLLCAVPYLSKDEEEMQAIRLRAMTEAYQARMRASQTEHDAQLRKALRHLRRSALALSFLPLLYGSYGMIFGRTDAFLTFFGGVVLLNSALGFLLHEKQHPPPARPM